MAQAPSGELASLAIGKETVFGSPVVPTVFLVPSDINFIGSNELLERTGSRRRVGRTYPATGMFMGKGSFAFEVDPDTFGPVLKLTQGAETVVANGATGWDHTYTIASPRANFTAQINRVTDAINCTGNRVASLNLTANPKSILEARVTTEYASEALVGTPVAPTYSTLYPFVFENPGNYGQINGVQSAATILAWDINVATGLTADFSGFGLGRIRGPYPETLTKVNGGCTIAFEDDTAYRLFWGADAATGPQSTITSTSLAFKYVSTDLIAAGLPYSLQVICANCFIQGADVNIRPQGYLTQVIKFEAFETTNGASDDVKFILTNASATPF